MQTNPSIPGFFQEHHAPNQLQTSEHAYRQSVFINQARTAQWILGCITVAIGITYLRAPMWSLLLQCSAFLLATVINWWCLTNVRQNYQLRFARINLASGLGLSVIAMTFTTERLVLAAAIVVIFLVLSSAYFESLAGTTGWGVLGIIAFLGSLLFRHLVAVPVLQLGILEPILFYAMPSLIMVLAGQYSQQINHYLRSALAESEAHRQALSIAYTAVEQQVQERTADLESANRQLQTYAAQAADLAAERERNTIAREIHDGLSHYFTGIGSQLQATQVLLDVNRDRAVRAIGKARQLADEGLDEVRRSISTLRENPLATRSLPEAIEALLDTARSEHMTAQLDLHGTPRTLDPDGALTLYRTAQEGITNTLKYAQAQSIQITLDYRPVNQVTLTIQDDGQGAATTEGGFGLIGMRERIEILGGTMHVATAPGHGFTITVEVPA